MAYQTLPPGWLERELRDIDREVAKWPIGIKESFDELQRQIDRDIRLARARDRVAR